MKSARTLLFLVGLIGLAASFSTLSRRINVEHNYSQVEIAADLVEVQTLAGNFRQNLHALKEAGITSMAITEPVIGELLSTGRAAVIPVTTTEETVAWRVVATNSPKLQSIIDTALNNLGLTADGSLTLPVSEISQIPVGFDTMASDIAAVQNEGLLVVARAQNYPRAGRKGMDFLRQQLISHQIKNVIFAGDEVIGWRGAVDEAAELFGSTQLRFGSIEFSKQKGSEKLEDKLHGRYIRVHSISGAEMDKFQPPSAVERFVRAARERNVRLLYVRLFESNGADAIAVNSNYIRDIKHGLIRAGFQIGQAGIVDDPTPLRWELILMSLGVAAGAALMLSEYFTVSVPSAIAFLITFGFTFAALSLTGEIGRKITALVAALAFPTWAAARAARLSGLEECVPNRPGGRTLQIISHYLGAIMCVVFGGLFIAGLLSGRTFMTETNQFMGVKLAHIVPILVVFIVAALGRLGYPLPWSAFWDYVRTSLKRIWTTPVLFGYAFIALFALVILGVVVLRSGNDTGVGVSGIELRFRAILDRVLYVRPRTKEIFVGFPSLWAAIWLVSVGEKNWARLFFVASVVGLVSALNTFCHIHTPLEVSLLRVINGVWVGAIFGVGLVIVLVRLGLGRAAVQQ